ncbi:hypothetical protein GCM10023165_47860 [Variovorax defluvii]|uniref:Uncharacterized protein n=1 Tax=Variovorax defluvii TaxID=913761 RepID=A0ABP8ICA6_9BURK
MPDKNPNSRDRSPQRQTVSAGRGGDRKVKASSIQANLASDNGPEITPPLSDAELVQLRVRVIALENIVIALLAQAPERHLELAREMAVYISPRQGFTPHPMTVHAAAEMNSLVRRADAFRTGEQAGWDGAKTE